MSLFSGQLFTVLRHRRVRITAAAFGLLIMILLALFGLWKSVHYIWLAHGETIAERQKFDPIMTATWRKLNWCEALNAGPSCPHQQRPWFNPRLPPVNQPPNFPYEISPVGNNWFTYSALDPGSILPSKSFKWKNGLSITGSHSEPMIAWHGTLHSHTGWSDGAATPQDAFAFASNQGGLDFLAVTDHPEFWFFNPERTWGQLKEIAVMAETPDFVALPGFEYSSPIFGHYIVLGSAGVCSAVKCSTLEDFYQWLQLPENHEALVAFAHPQVQRDNATKFEFREMEFIPGLKRQMFGVEVIHWSGHDRFLFGFSGSQPFIDEALAKGWQPGALGSQDNHGLNWGLPNSRIGVLAKSLNRSNLMEALRARRFYATSSRDLELSFDVALPGQPWMQMGSAIATARTSRNIVKSPNKATAVATRLRLFEPDEFNVPRRIEWILDGRIVGRQDFEGLPNELSNSEGDEKYYGGEILSSFPESLVRDGRRHYVYVRVYMGEDFATYAQTSPIIFTPELTLN